MESPVMLCHAKRAVKHCTTSKAKAGTGPASHLEQFDQVLSVARLSWHVVVAGMPDVAYAEASVGWGPAGQVVPDVIGVDTQSSDCPDAP